MMKYVLTMNEEQAQTVLSALDFYIVYAAVSELIERRKASGEWKGLADDGKAQDYRI